MDSNTIKYVGGKYVYDCSRKLFPEQTWEALPASHARMKCLRRAFNDDAFVRVIRVDIREFPNEPAKILDADVDDHYWKMVCLDDEGDRFAAERTREPAKPLPLALTDFAT